MTIEDKIIMEAMHLEAKTGEKQKVIVSTEFYKKMEKELEDKKEIEIKDKKDKSGFSSPIVGIELYVDELQKEDYIFKAHLVED